MASPMKLKSWLRPLARPLPGSCQLALSQPSTDYTTLDCCFDNLAIILLHILLVYNVLIGPENGACVCLFL